MPPRIDDTVRRHRLSPPNFLVCCPFKHHATARGMGGGLLPGRFHMFPPSFARHFSRSRKNPIFCEQNRANATACRLAFYPAVIGVGDFGTPLAFSSLRRKSDCGRRRRFEDFGTAEVLDSYLKEEA